MPIGFWQSFKNVAYIGDCLEISIEKPSDAFEQALLIHGLTIKKEIQSSIL